MYVRHRNKGEGSIRREPKRTGWCVAAPQNRGRTERLGRYDTYSQAERVLNAWFVVEAFLALLSRDEQCESQLAS